MFPAKNSRQPTCCGDHANGIRIQRIPRARLLTKSSFRVVKYCLFPLKPKQDLSEEKGRWLSLLLPSGS